VEAFGLTVIDFDGAKISALAQQLQDQGYVVSTVSLSQTDAQPAAPEAATAVADAAAVGAVVGAEQQVVGDGPDNSLPFKCPACGRTYQAQLICANQHEPTQTLATADVLAGATADNASGDAPAEPPATPAAETPAAPPTPAEPPAAADTSGAKVADPSWPQ
jgi:hypothetical protein